MEGLIITLLIALAVGLLLMMFAQGITRRVDFFSVRNIYLAGFIIYHVSSPISALQDGTYIGFKIIDPLEAAKWMLIYTYIYVGVYLFSYHRLKISRWFASKFSGGPSEASDSLLTGVAILMIISALATRGIGMQIRPLAAISTNISIALAAAACAIVGWIWGGRRLNPAVILLAVVVVGISFGMMLGGFYSRRPLIGILVGFAWGAYYRWARYMSPTRLIYATAPLVLAAGVVIAAFTAVRGLIHHSTEGVVTVEHLRGADLSSGADSLFSGQACGAAALWVFEKYPSEFDYQHLFSLRYMAIWPIPSALWEDKPAPFSKDIARLARLRGVNRDVITLPPGVVGYAAAEGGFYALIIYALFFGQFTRFFDDLLTLNPGNPYIILSVGCAIGHFLGLARGDIAIFANVALISFFSAYVLILVSSKVFGRSSQSTGQAYWPQV
jgi:hypothetical protein